MKTTKCLVLGVTASGKGSLAFNLARETDSEIISVDSMKVYRRMDIGTAKPSREAREVIHHHMIDILEPSESFNVAMFCKQALSSIEAIHKRAKSVIAVGGTALYIKALLYGLFEGPGADEQVREALEQRISRQGLADLYRELQDIDPQAAGMISHHDRRRIVRALEVYQLTGLPISRFQRQFTSEACLDNWTVIGIRREKDLENRRINTRVKKMIQAGLVDEVKALLAEEKPLSQQAAVAIGYAEIIAMLRGEMDLDTAVEKIKINTRRLAKSQRTWYKTFPFIHWLDIDEHTPAKIISEMALNIWNKSGQ